MKYIMVILLGLILIGCGCSGTDSNGDSIYSVRIESTGDSLQYYFHQDFDWNIRPDSMLVTLRKFNKEHPNLRIVSMAGDSDGLRGTNRGYYVFCEVRK